MVRHVGIFKKSVKNKVNAEFSIKMLQALASKFDFEFTTVKNFNK